MSNKGNKFRKCNFIYGAREFTVLVICLMILTLGGCSIFRGLNQDKLNIPRRGEEDQNRDEDKNDLQDETLDKDTAIEENINGEEFDEDEKLTKDAERKNAKQDDIGVSQREAEKEMDSKVESKWEVVRVFSSIVPSGIEIDLKYNQYPIGYHYLYLTDDSVNIRKEPTTRSKILCRGMFGEKLTMMEEVRGEFLAEGQSDVWYKVACKENGNIITGYVFSKLGQVREFRFDEMVNALERLRSQAEQGGLVFISNYKNYNGIPPTINGQEIDHFGYRRSQSAAGYEREDRQSVFRYIPDGMLARVVDQSGSMLKLAILDYGQDLWVDRKYVDLNNAINKLLKAVVIDRHMQNQVSFEYRNGKWVIVSYTLATTGKKGPFSLETPLGYFRAIQKRDRFYYYADGTTDIAGYAPYAVRFSAGGYIHGVPVEYEIMEGEKVDPGLKEYLHTIGTMPRSHMCVRNYTSHARFVYDWIDIGTSAVIVIQ